MNREKVSGTFSLVESPTEKKRRGRHYCGAPVRVTWDSTDTEPQTAASLAPSFHSLQRCQVRENSVKALCLDNGSSRSSSRNDNDYIKELPSSSSSISVWVYPMVGVAG